MMKRVLMIAGLVVAAGIAYGLYEFNRIGADTSKQTPDFELTAKELAAQFEDNEAVANEKFLDKIIQVEGIVLNQEKGEMLILTLEGTDMVNLRAELTADHVPEIENGNMVKIKGVCTGLLLDVVLTECVTID